MPARGAGGHAGCFVAGMHSALFGLKRGYYGALRYARRTLGAFGVTPARFDLMFALRENGWHLQSELRRILGVAGPTVSRMVKSLEKLGLVLKERAVHDRRERYPPTKPKFASRRLI